MHAPVKPDLATRARDLRIDLVRGIANLSIFVDHIPHNAVNLLTLRNFGFSGATDLFVFVGGYAAALLYGQMAAERGFLVTATRILKRVWQLYAAYIVLFVIYIDVIGQVAARYAVPDIIDEYNSRGSSIILFACWRTGCCCRQNRSISIPCNSSFRCWRRFP
jgi:hypothetical protein